ncbi:MAG: hypothetical protein AAFV53_09680, partial [Myxococcota bacterium]
LAACPELLTDMGLRERLLRRLLGRRPSARSPSSKPPRSPVSLSDYAPLHPELLSLRPAHLTAATRDALDDGSPEALRALLTEMHPELYAFRPLTDAWCTQMREELAHFSTWALETGCRYDPPNSMNQYGVVLDEIGFSMMLSTLTAEVVRPLAAYCFPEVDGGALNRHHGFSVEYRRGGDVDLGFHVDDSEVTLNLCLSEGFVGGDLFFEGRRCAQHRQTGCSSSDRYRYAHQPGVALLHAGKHRHGAMELKRGERLNLILWCQSDRYRQRDDGRCPPWCQRSMRR